MYIREINCAEQILRKKTGHKDSELSVVIKVWYRLVTTTVRRGMKRNLPIWS